ncbi:hypothetical protein BC831DRAFT_314863 [Entophlyctis helioformis]|nr:hypothetical protein BC831DRAFT_314863 [Entophlyctis helioformis]
MRSCRAAGRWQALLALGQTQPGGTGSGKKLMRGSPWLVLDGAMRQEVPATAAWCCARGMLTGLATQVGKCLCRAQASATAACLAALPECGASLNARDQTAQPNGIQRCTAGERRTSQISLYQQHVAALCVGHSMAASCKCVLPLSSWASATLRLSWILLSAASESWFPPGPSPFVWLQSLAAQHIAETTCQGVHHRSQACFIAHSHCPSAGREICLGTRPPRFTAGPDARHLLHLLCQTWQRRSRLSRHSCHSPADVLHTRTILLTGAFVAYPPFG